MFKRASGRARGVRYDLHVAYFFPLQPALISLNLDPQATYFKDYNIHKITSITSVTGRSLHDQNSISAKTGSVSWFGFFCFIYIHLMNVS